MTAHRMGLEIFGTALNLAFDSKGWASLRRKFGELEPWKDRPGPGLTHDMLDKKTGMQEIAILIELGAARDDAELAGLVAHESLHVAMSICAHHQVNVDIHNDETAAYLAQHVARWIWKSKP